MPFKDVPNKVDYPAQERELLQFWKENEAFSKMVAIHEHDPHWSFIDGPITANNPWGCTTAGGAPTKTCTIASGR